MTLSPGTRLGPYEVSAQIGVGGMGEVYRATDTNLKRQVALKVLPTTLAGVPERLARFQREAEVLAALNHPNIAVIYGLERSGLTTALVMELVEGPTLAARIEQGPLPIEEALPLARQIADALAAAHDQGIIHRDLKPANIKVRPDGTVKVLDFGLAKAMEPAVAASPEFVTQLPTITTPAMTQLGMVLGTAAYMSPEQAKGRRVDRQTDVWAFGAVLFEMLSGRRAFEAEDVSETLAAVLRAEVDWSRLPADVPPRVVLVIRRCLQKDQKERIGDIQDVRLALDGAFETTATSGAAATSRVDWRPLAAAALVAGLVGAGATMLGTRNASQPTEARVTQRLSVVTPADRPVAFGWSPGKSLAISPDGSRVVYVATKSDVPGDTDSQNVLVLREFASGDSTDLPGTAGARQPFFSADGRWVGFFTNAALKKVSLGGGNPVTLAEPISNGRWAFGAWTHDDQIIFSTGESGLHLVPAAGGTPSVVVAPDATSGERYLRPTAIPGTDAVLFDVMHLNQGRSRIEAIRLSSGERKVVVENGSSSRHLSTGHLVFQQDDGILLASIDARTLSLSAAAVPVPYNVRRDMAARFTTLQMDVSRTGTMIYAPAVDGSRTLGVVDGTGAFQALGVPAGDIDMASASPDGQLVAFAPLGQVYVYDRTRGSILKLTQSGRDTGPAWHPNGRAVVVSSGTPSGQVLVLKGVDGSQRTLYSVEGIALLRHPSWSPDGTHLAFTIQKDAQQDIWVTTTGDTPKAEPLIDGLAAEYFPRFSPDGRWLAYVSDESGRLETYVRRFPTGERVLASVEGGGPPAWSRDGRTLYFQHLAGDKPEIAAVPMISTSTGLRPGTPRRVLEMQTPGATGELAEYLRSSTNGQRWDVLPDGRFLVIRGAATQTGSREIAVVQNWFEDLKGLAPSK